MKLIVARHQKGLLRKSTKVSFLHGSGMNLKIQSPNREKNKISGPQNLVEEIQTDFNKRPVDKETDSDNPSVSVSVVKSSKQCIAKTSKKIRQHLKKHGRPCVFYG